MLKDKLTEFVEELSNYRVHTVKELNFSEIPEGATVFIRSQWVKWVSGRYKRKYCYVTYYDSYGDLCHCGVRGGVFLIKI